MKHTNFKGKSALHLLTLGTLALGSASALNLPAVSCTSRSGARCNLTSSNAGKIGQGLPLDLGGFVFIGSGFVDAGKNTLYVPVEFGGQDDNQGVIMAVDLATGNRQVVSGYDGETWVGGQGYDLGRVMVVRPGPAGSVFVLVDKGLSSRTELIRVDVSSGKRDLVWASKVSGDSAQKERELSQYRLGSDTLCRGGDRAALKPASTFETDGMNAYLFMVNNPGGSGTGVVKVGLSGGGCSWISQYFPDGTAQVGGGPTVNTLSPLVFGSALVGGEFIAATGPNPNGNTLFGVNLQTGERRTLSLKNLATPARSKGSGEAEVGYLGTLAYTGSGFATIRATSNDSNPDVVFVNAGGDRTLIKARTGSLMTSFDNNVNIVAAIPGTPKVIIAFKKALHVLDLSTGDSYVLSQ